MSKIRYVFPNLLTLFNLLFGCMAILIVFRGEKGLDQFTASWLIFVAAICDVFDGLVARALDARSDFGKEMDSLADLVSFGVAPGMILFHWLLLSMNRPEGFSLLTAGIGEILILSVALIYIAAGAIRLARFNARQADSKGFTGLPIPAAAIIVCTLWLMVGEGGYENLLNNQTVIIITILVVSGLMVSNIKMLSLKLTGISFLENIYPYTLLLVSGVLIILFWIKGILLAMGFYIVLSLANNLINIVRKARK